MAHRKSGLQQRLFMVRLTLVVLLIVYWLSMFVGTHIPRVPDALILAEQGDKVLHLCGYGGLAVILLSWRASRGPVAFPTVGLLWVLIAGYGIFDETTQTLVGRDCELADWIADVIGTTLGLAVAWPVMSRVFATRTPQRATP